MIFSVFFQWFGVFAFIGTIIITILCNKELKKQLPTEEEKKILVASETIQPNEKNKKVLRAKTMELRARLHLVQEVKKYIQENGLDKTTQVINVEEK